MRPSPLTICLFVILLSGAGAAQAQFLGIGRRAGAGDIPPKAILIVLQTRQGQRAHLVATHSVLLRDFDRDVAEVMRRTVLDWSRYFNYCPVYFIYDTATDLLHKDNWSGLLLDSALQPAAHPVVAPGDKAFYIAYFGTALPQPEPEVTGSIRNVDSYDPTSLLREKLLVCNANFSILPGNGPRTNYVRALRPGGMNAPEYLRYRQSIDYNSSRWYVDYQPCAFSYDATLRRYFRPRR